jgi:L-iditol 2-dehydrogenase
MGLGRQAYWQILRNQLIVIGTWNSSFTHDNNDDWHYVLDRLKSGDISPEQLITHEFALENIISGFELMRDKKEEYIKVIMN